MSKKDSRRIGLLVFLQNNTLQSKKIFTDAAVFILFILFFVCVCFFWVDFGAVFWVLATRWRANATILSVLLRTGDHTL